MWISKQTCRVARLRRGYGGQASVEGRWWGCQDGCSVSGAPARRRLALQVVQATVFGGRGCAESFRRVPSPPPNRRQRIALSGEQFRDHAFGVGNARHE